MDTPLQRRKRDHSDQQIQPQMIFSPGVSPLVLQWSERDIQSHIEREKAWGLSTSLDLTSCDHHLITNAAYIEQVVIQLCDEILCMKRYGPTQIVKFGTGETEGYSLLQLIETSLVSAHFADASHQAFFDIFSCAAYPPMAAARFCGKAFGAAAVCIKNITFRGKGIDS